MEIGYIFQDFPELSQTFVFDQMRYLRNEGNRLVVIAKRELDSNSELITHNFYDHIFYPKRRVSVESIWTKYTSHYWDKKYKLTAKSIVKQFIQKAKVPDILIAHFGPNIILASWIKKYFLKFTNKSVPVIGVFHGYDLSKHIQKFGFKYYNLHKDNIDCFVVISNYWRKLLLQNGFKSEKVILCRIGVKIDDNTGIFHQNYGINNILSVGRLVDKKGFDDLITAFSYVSENYKNIRLQIVGCGPNEKPLKSLASSLGQNEKIEFLGALNHQKTLQTIKDADLLVLASKTAKNGDMEGIPVVLMEAMAVKTPVISTEHSGISELVTNRESGLLAPESNPEELSRAINYAINSPNELQIMAQEGHRVIKNQYNMDIQVENFSQIVKKVLNKHSLKNK